MNPTTPVESDVVALIQGLLGIAVCIIGIDIVVTISLDASRRGEWRQIGVGCAGFIIAFFGLISRGDDAWYVVPMQLAVVGAYAHHMRPSWRARFGR